MNKILILYIDEDQLNDFVLALVKHKLRVQLPSYNLLLKKNGKILRSTNCVPIKTNYYDNAEIVEADSAVIVGESSITSNESSNQIAASDIGGCNSEDELSVVGDDNSNTLSVVDNTFATSATPTSANSIYDVPTKVSVVVVNPTKQHQRKRRRPSFTITYPNTKPRKDCSALLKNKFLLFFLKD